MFRPRALAVAVSTFLLLGLLTEASAQQFRDEQTNELTVVNLVGVFSLAANTVTGIGTGAQFSDSDPGLGWGISAIVTGAVTLITSAMAIPLAVEIQDKATDVSTASGWLVVGPSLFLAATTLTLGIISTVRWSSIQAEYSAAPQMPTAMVEPTGPTAMLVPVVGKDKMGNPSFGLGLQVSSF